MKTICIDNEYSKIWFICYANYENEKLIESTDSRFAEYKIMVKGYLGMEEGYTEILLNEISFNWNHYKKMIKEGC